MNADLNDLRQRWELPTESRDIVVIGAGGIVNDAQLPAYRDAGLGVRGIYDLDRNSREATARRFSIPEVHTELEQAVADPGAVYDIATPPEQIRSVLSAIPEGAAVLIQKPMGRDLAEAREILQIARTRNLTAAINFQLRFSPASLALSDAVARGLLGDLSDLEFHVNIFTPWEIFPYLLGMPRMEILMHSIHYLDLTRAILGEPAGVYARTVRHPLHPDLASVATSAILDYGDAVRCCLSVNHQHRFGPRHQTAQLRLEGSEGAATIVLGVCLDYPRGRPDSLEINTGGDSWHEVELCGSWFPDAFAGPMANLQRFASGEDHRLVTSVEDAVHTMALVEAAYTSSEAGGTPIPKIS